MDCCLFCANQLHERRIVTVFNWTFMGKPKWLLNHNRSSFVKKMHLRMSSAMSLLIWFECVRWQAIGMFMRWSRKSEVSTAVAHSLAAKTSLTISPVGVHQKCSIVTQFVIICNVFNEHLHTLLTVTTGTFKDIQTSMVVEYILPHIEIDNQLSLLFQSRKTCSSTWRTSIF